MLDEVIGANRTAARGEAKFDPERSSRKHFSADRRVFAHDAIARSFVFKRRWFDAFLYTPSSPMRCRLVSLALVAGILPGAALSAQSPKILRWNIGSYDADVVHRVVLEQSDSGQLRVTHDRTSILGVALNARYVNPACTEAKGGSALVVTAKSLSPRLDSLGVTSIAEMRMIATMGRNVSPECRATSPDYLRSRARVDQEWTLTRRSTATFDDGDAILVQAPSWHGDLLPLMIRADDGEYLIPLRRDGYAMHFPAHRGQKLFISGSASVEGFVHENSAGSVACRGCGLFQPQLGLSLTTLRAAMRRAGMPAIRGRGGWTFIETVASRSMLRQRIVEHARASLPCLTVGAYVQDSSLNAVCTLPDVRFVPEGVEVSVRVRPMRWGGGDTLWTSITGVYPLRLLNKTLTLREPTRLTQSSPLQGTQTDVPRWMIGWNPLPLQPVPEEAALRAARIIGNGCLKPTFDEREFPTLEVKDDVVTIRLATRVEFISEEFCRPRPPRDPAVRR